MKKQPAPQKLRWSINQVALTLFGILALAHEGAAAWKSEACNLPKLGLGMALLGGGLAMLQPSRFSPALRLGALGCFSSICWFSYEEWCAGRISIPPSLDAVGAPLVISLMSLFFACFGSHPMMCTFLEHLSEADDFGDTDWD